MAFNDWGNATGKDKGNIYFTQSTDGGETWSKPVQVNNDGTRNDQWFPALAEKTVIPAAPPDSARAW